MVKLVGYVKMAKGKGRVKLNENFRTVAEAQKFRKFLGRDGKDIKIIARKRKPQQGSSFGSFGGFGGSRKFRF